MTTIVRNAQKVANVVAVFFGVCALIAGAVSPPPECLPAQRGTV